MTHVHVSKGGFTLILDMYTCGCMVLIHKTIDGIIKSTRIVMDQLGNGKLKMMGKCRDGCPKLRGKDE